MKLGNHQATTPPAFALQKTPSLPSSSRTPSDSSGIPIDTPPSSGQYSQGGGRRLSKFTAFSGSSASSTYSSDNESLRDRERYHRVTEHPDISTVFEEGSSFEVERVRDNKVVYHRPAQSTSTSNSVSQRYPPRTGTISSAHSGRSNKSTTVHPFAVIIHRAPSPPSSHTRAISPHISSSRSHTTLSDASRMQHKPAHQVTLAAEEDADEEDKCPICVESLEFSYRLPGEKPHVVPECGHALHEVSSPSTLSFGKCKLTR